MAKNLDWFQARRIGRIDRRRIRRDAWRHWLEYDAAVFLWFIYQPPGVTVVQEGVETTLQEGRGVALAEQFTSLEFLAHDWTDEPWSVPTSTTPGAPGDSGSDTGAGPATGSGSSGGGGTTPPAAEPGGGGDSSSTPTPRAPDNSGGTGSDSGGAGSWLIFGGGGGGGGGGGHGGGNNPPPQLPAEKDFTPTVELEIETTVDGPDCFIHIPDEGTAFVNVTVPHPEGSTVNILGLSVTCFGQTKTQTVGPGASTAFEFKGPVGPDGIVRATCTVSDFKGRTWTGADSKQWAPMCLLPIYAWGGTKDVTHRCTHATGPIDGYDVHDVYETKAQYAVNPTAGAGKTGVKTSLELNGPVQGTETTTPYPTGSPSSSTYTVAPPASITCTVGSDKTISAVSPASLNRFPPSSGPTVTGTPPNECTETITANEYGPNGAE